VKEEKKIADMKGVYVAGPFGRKEQEKLQGIKRCYIQKSLTFRDSHPLPLF